MCIFCYYMRIIIEGGSLVFIKLKSGIAVYLLYMQYKEFFWYLFESYSKTWKAYWLDPRGKFYEVYTKGKFADNDGHFSFAQKYCTDQGLSLEDPPETLKTKGWSRIAFNYYNDRVMHVDTLPQNYTATILKALKRKAEDLEASVVKDTNRERDLELVEIGGRQSTRNSTGF